MKLLLRVTRFLFLGLLTLLCIAAMFFVSRKNAGNGEDAGQPQPRADVITAPKALVAVQEIRHELDIELLDTYSGMIRPLERFSLAFEIGGRIESLGKNGSAQELDEGDRVYAGQVLASLDKRALTANKDEAQARLKLAEDELQRARELRERNRSAISPREYDTRRTSVEVARAQLALMQKQHDDATLRSPVDGVISRRLAIPGESVTANQVVFQIVQVDQVLLVLGVPESNIPEIELRLREVARERARREKENPGGDNPGAEFRVYVELIGRDRYGSRWPQLVGTMHQVGETADDRTGLFEVEILLDNTEGLLKPGMVARAELVTSYVDGYRVPASSIVFRNNRAYLFTLRSEPAEVRAMFFAVGQETVYRAERIELPRWVEQGSEIIVPEAPRGIATAVVRGQHRLVDGQLVQIVPIPEEDESEVRPAVSVGAKL